LINGFGPEEKEAVMEIIASLGSLAIGVVILYIIVKLLALPFKLVWNGIIGAVMLWLANLLGGALFNVKIHITIIKALIAGFFGIPGAAAVILWDLFVK
jgi:inhibitor of the pro-sigma K processing machinery